MHWVCSRFTNRISFYYFYLLLSPSKETDENISTCFQSSMNFLPKLRNIKHQNKIQHREVTGYVMAVGSTVSILYMAACIWWLLTVSVSVKMGCTLLERSWPKCWNAWPDLQKALEQHFLYFFDQGAIEAKSSEQLSILIFCYLSATFNTIDHSFLVIIVKRSLSSKPIFLIFCFDVDGKTLQTKFLRWCYFRLYQ